MRLDNVDGKIADIVQVITEAFQFAGDATTLTHRIDNFREAVDELLQKTICCFHFVKQCTSEEPLDAEGNEVINNCKARLLDLKRILDAGLSFSAAVPDRESGAYSLQLMPD